MIVVVVVALSFRHAGSNEIGCNSSRLSLKAVEAGAIVRYNQLVAWHTANGVYCCYCCCDVCCVVGVLRNGRVTSQIIVDSLDSIKST